MNIVLVGKDTRTENFLINAQVYCNHLCTNISTECSLISAPFLIQITPILLQLYQNLKSEKWLLSIECLYKTGQS